MYASIRRGIRHRIGLQPEVDARRPGGAGHAGRCGTPATYRSSAGLTRADCPICLSAAVEASTDRRAVSTRVSQKFEHLLGLADAAFLGWRARPCGWAGAGWAWPFLGGLGGGRRHAVGVKIHPVGSW